MKILMIVIFMLCIWIGQRNHLSPRGINSDVLSRILFSKTREELAFEDEIEADFEKQFPGFCNRGVECSLSGDEKILGEESYARNGINVMLSDKISYNRTPPDVRNSLCGSIHYDVEQLPTASVIIIFLEEPYSVILRTVHSVLNTAPSMLLNEIILVDDFSTSTDLKGKLSHYVKTRLPSKVRLLRLEKQ